MSRSQESLTSGKNWILTTLPEDEYGRFARHLEAVDLPVGKTLYVPDDDIYDVYFPNSGLASMVLITESGTSIEVGTIGSEGMIGIPIVMGVNKTPYMVEVQVGGYGHRMKANLLRSEFDRGGLLQKVLLRYTFLLLTQLSQSALCNRFHTVGERLCKWLLVTQDRVQSDTFKVTQDDLSHMMGSHRPNVNVASRLLQQAGLIQYNRGVLTILDRRRLEAAACECYKNVKERYDELLQFRF